MLSYSSVTSVLCLQSEKPCLYLRSLKTVILISPKSIQHVLKRYPKNLFLQQFF